MFAFKLLALQLACATIALANVNSSLPEGYIYYEDIGTAYKISSSRVSWTAAEEACSSEGAHLAVIDTKTKLECIKSESSLLEWVWIGIFRASRTSAWQSVVGDVNSTDLPWALLYPTLVGDCVAVDGVLSGLSNWSCGRRNIYACEISGQPQVNTTARRNLD